MTAVLLALSGVASVAYGTVLTGRPTGGVRSAAKTVAVSALACVAVVLGAPLLVVVALVLGSVGDFFLSLDREHGFLLGLVSFAIAHVAYVVAMIEFADTIRAVPAVALIVFALAMAGVLRPRAGSLRVPVQIYVGVITAMGVAAVSLPGARWMSTLAAMSFVLSDSVLATELFVLGKDDARRRMTRHVIWFTYYAAQALFLWDLGVRV